MNPEPLPTRVRPAESGFTLVEIMVVIVILGLLATLVVQNVVGVSDEARVTKAQTDVVTIAGTVKLYRSKKGTLPENLDVLIQKDEKTGRVWLDSLPKDPWDHDYEIRIGNTPQDWEVVSLGPDGVQSEDDITSAAANRREK
jgi:general secretion pathway protein G